MLAECATKQPANTQVVSILQQIKNFSRAEQGFFERGRSSVDIHDIKPLE